jgi:actin-like ATPase involved in cell morphogenesis
VAYHLGIDIGTTYSAAAVWRDGQLTVANLGERAPVIPSLLFLAEDGELLVGEAAERRGPSDPRRMAREFKRRVGDPTPVIVGGAPYSADALMSKLLRWVVDRVVAIEGGRPESVAISYPANWGAFKQDLLAQEIRLADLGDGIDVATLTEPEAAAIYYASQERVAEGAVVAVYDLGGGTFDVAVLRKVANGWHILGEPEGIERLGGIDFDEAVFQHVTATLGDEYEALDPEDDATLQALLRLRRECVEAKEALSEDTDATIPVLLPGIQRDVRLTRVEFEDMIRPALTGSIEATKRALRTAKVEPADVTAVLLVGGSSRVPLVGQMVGASLGRPVAIDVHPKYGIALGAAILAAERASDSGPLTSQITAVPAEIPLGPSPAADDDEPEHDAAAQGENAADGGAEAFDVAADGPPVGDGPEVPVESPGPADAAVAPVDEGGHADETDDAATTMESPLAQPEPVEVTAPVEPPRTVRVPAPIVDEPTVTEPIAAPRTAEQPVVAAEPPPLRNPNGGGSSGGRRPPVRDEGRGGRLLLLAAVAALVVAMAGLLFKLTEDSSDAETGDSTTTSSSLEQSSTTASTSSTTDPETTTTSTSSTTTTTAPPEPVDVPDVAGQTQADATSLIEDAGLEVGSVSEAPSDTIGDDLAIGTDPAAGTSLDPGSPVTLILSTGPEQVTVPDVTDVDEGSATTQLENVGLEVGVTPAPVDDPTLVGVVLDQSPAAGTDVAAGTSVTLTVGTAP